MSIDAAKLLAGITPGPWKFEAGVEESEGEFYVCHPATVCDATPVCNSRREADARLAAAAPTLAAEHIALTAEVERFTKLAEGLAGAGKAFLQYEGHRVYCGHAPDYIKPCVCGFNDADASFRTALTAWENRDV